MGKRSSSYVQSEYQRTRVSNHPTEPADAATGYLFLHGAAALVKGPCSLKLTPELVSALDRLQLR